MRAPWDHTKCTLRVRVIPSSLRTLPGLLLIEKKEACVTQARGHNGRLSSCRYTACVSGLCGRTCQGGGQRRVDAKTLPPWNLALSTPSVLAYGGGTEKKNGRTEKDHLISSGRPKWKLMMRAKEKKKDQSEKEEMSWQVTFQATWHTTWGWGNVRASRETGT